MPRLRIAIVLVLTAATGCVYGERQVVREAPPPAVEAPPPPPYDASDTYQGYDADLPPPPRAGADVSNEAIFYDSLAPYGYWTFVAPYGRVWVPSVAYGWRPYYYGQWVLTDWGWTFVSDDPWGWAAYHYGRWNFAVGVGWYWIPGLVWGPAWVTWGWGAGYVTWCPMGPAGVVYGYHHPGWVAVPENHFTRPIATVAVPPQTTYRVVTQTRPVATPNATTPSRTHGFGPPVAQVARATGQQIHPVAVTQVVRPRAISPMPNAVSPMRSPPSTRPRTPEVARPGAGPRALPPGRSGGVAAPRSGVAAPPGSSAPRPVVPSYGAPPSSGAPHAAPSGGGAPHAAPPSGGGAPHASPPSGGGGGAPHAGPPSGGGSPRANHR